jgi:hypothetical protein
VFVILNFQGGHQEKHPDDITLPVQSKVLARCVTRGTR